MVTFSYCMDEKYLGYQYLEKTGKEADMLPFHYSRFHGWSWIAVLIVSFIQHTIFSYCIDDNFPGYQ